SSVCTSVLLCFCLFLFFFFFSSRRRHTRFSRDWSSDVCSSDLQDQQPLGSVPERRGVRRALVLPAVRSVGNPADLRAVQRGTGHGHLRLPRAPVQRGRRRGQVHRPATERGMTNQAKPSLEEFFGNAPAPLDGSSPWASRYASDLKRMIQEYSARRPRSVQKHLGPSELGEACSRQVVAKMANAP